MAKILHLVRHAKSSWADMTLSDFDRPLNKRGLHDAPMMGRRLTNRSMPPDIILCSPARRAHQTVELLIAQLDRPMDLVQFDGSIYEASLETLQQLVRSLPDACASAMIVGHNPSIGWLADRLSDGRIDRMPTCGIATIELETDQWGNAGTCRSRLLDFDYPKRD